MNRNIEIFLVDGKLNNRTRKRERMYLLGSLKYRGYTHCEKKKNKTKKGEKIQDEVKGERDRENAAD